mmetsp:Transcript_3208/g.3731  ORF Transcript_3208/g.3731 Transcript_3208/m.3731 type:complete len:100 (+) Transcript_3208:92-391(+)
MYVVHFDVLVVCHVLFSSIGKGDVSLARIDPDMDHVMVVHVSRRHSHFNYKWEVKQNCTQLFKIAQRTVQYSTVSLSLSCIASIYLPCYAFVVAMSSTS